MKLIAMLALVALTATPDHTTTSSFEKLGGKRLARFHRTRGASEAGRNIAVHLPASVLKTKNVAPLGRSKRWVVFRHEKVEYVISRRDPYFVQAARKAARNPRGGLLVKGRVTASSAGAAEKRWLVKVFSLQKYGKGRSRKERR